jgi:hypothetical protein
MPFFSERGIDWSIFYKPAPKSIRVGDLVFLDGDTETSIPVVCFPDTGNLFMSGRFAPANTMIGETLNWFVGDEIYEIDLEELYFRNSVSHTERSAKPWERKAFFMGHWKHYAKTGIYARAVIRLADEKAEPIYSPLHTLPTSKTDSIECFITD